MSTQEDIERLMGVGFGVLPMLKAVFADGHAVASRLPPRREWANPLAPTASQPVRPTPFATLAAAYERRFQWSAPSDHLRP